MKSLLKVAILLALAPVLFAEDSSLSKWLEAIGGKDRLQQIHSYHFRMNVETSGLKGVANEWGTSSGDHKVDLNLQDVYKSLTIFNAAERRAWLQDQNTKTQDIEGVDLQSEIAAAYIASFSQFFADRMPGKVEFSGPSTFRLTPEGGSTLTFVLDPASGLPIRMEEPAKDRTRVTTFEDWRNIDGVMVPFSQRQTTGDPKYDVLITLQEVRWNEPLDASAFAKPQDAGPDFHFDSGDRALGIAFDLISNHIFVPVSVNGSKPLWMVLDTAADTTVISKRKAKEFGFKMEGDMEARGAGEGSTEVSFIKDASFRVQGVEVLHQLAAAFDLQAIEDYEGHAFDGILGYDFISRFVVEIDYAARKVNLYKPETFKRKPGGTSIPILIEGNAPIVFATVTQNGKQYEGKFDIDTGARTSLALNKQFHESNKISEGVPSIEAVWGLGVGGHTKSRLGRVQQFAMGEQKLPDVLTSFTQDVSGAFADPNLAGNIGGEILRRFTVTFDYSRKQMLLEPNSNFAQPFRFDMSGLNLTSQGPEFKVIRVNRVVAGSPAAEAGVEEGDELISINDRPASTYPLEQLRQDLKNESATIHITLMRKGVEKKVTLVLRPLI